MIEAIQEWSTNVLLRISEEQKQILHPDSVRTDVQATDKSPKEIVDQHAD